MDLMREYAGGLYWELTSILNWAVKNWAVTMAVILVVIYWARKNSRANRGS
jgi:hypothetical protein